MIVVSHRTALQPQTGMADSQQVLPAGSLLYSGFWRTETQIFLLLQANSSTVYNEEDNFHRDFTWRGVVSLIQKNTTLSCIHPLKMDTCKLSAKARYL